MAGWFETTQILQTLSKQWQKADPAGNKCAASKAFQQQPPFIINYLYQHLLTWIGTHHQQLLPWELGTAASCNLQGSELCSCGAEPGIMNSSLPGMAQILSCLTQTLEKDSHTPVWPAGQRGNLPSSLGLTELKKEKELLFPGENINFQVCSVDVFQRKVQE